MLSWSMLMPELLGLPPAKLTEPWLLSPDFALCIGDRPPSSSSIGFGRYMMSGVRAEAQEYQECQEKSSTIVFGGDLWTGMAL